jgi:hypothetical protein
MCVYVLCTDSTFQVKTWPPSGSVSWRLSEQLSAVASNNHFLQTIFNIFQPFLAWLSKVTLSFWDIPEHFLHSSFFWHSFQVSETFRSPFSNFWGNIWVSLQIHQLYIGADPLKTFLFIGSNIIPNAVFPCYYARTVNLACSFFYFNKQCTIHSFYLNNIYTKSLLPVISSLGSSNFVLRLSYVVSKLL